MSDIFGENDGLGHELTLQDWVIGKCNEWGEYYEANYSDRHDEYMRLYRNKWSSGDKTRDSERSKLIAPALAQAVESNVAEVEEATFGRGKLFGIKDDMNDQETADMTYLSKKLHEDFALARVRSCVAEVLVNAAVYGTGVGEIIIEEHKTYTPGSRPLMEGDMQEIGVTETYRPLVKINPIQPKNFLIDPSATGIDDALGCAIDEFVSEHIVQELQESGVYSDEEHVSGAASDESIEADPEVSNIAQGRVRLTKYYGKVPRDLLIASGVDEEDIPNAGHYVESIVVIANEGVLLKAIPSPYMCQDRPIVAFQWDIVPSIFWGRGVCEKGYMSQKALDAELRARIDALALTTHPMLAVDATRIPRGHKLEVRPGRMIMTNGSPSDSIMPFNFGQLNAVTFQQGAALQAMVAQATGASDGAQGMPNDATAAGMSMSQGALIKRQKRTLVNFQENFLIPFIRKAAYRYMQFDPENYPIKDYTFTPYSSLGAMAREYEVNQLSQILQMVPPDSPAHSAIVKAVIDHLNVANREEIMEAIDAAAQPNPEAQQQAQQAQQMQMAITQGQVQLLNSQAAESQSRATKYNTESQLMPTEMTLKYSDTDKDGQIDADFEKRVRMAELLLKEQEIKAKAASAQDPRAGAEAQLMQAMAQRQGQQAPQAPQAPQGGMPRG